MSFMWARSFPTFKSIKNRNRKGCRYCAPNAPVDEQKAIKVMRRAELEPLEPFKNSHSKWKSKCMKCDSIVSPAFNTIQQGQGGCLVCAKRFVEPEDAAKLFSERVEASGSISWGK